MRRVEPTQTLDGSSTPTAADDSRAASARGGSPAWWDTGPKDVLRWAVEGASDSLQNLITDLLGSLLKPIVGTPTPRGSGGWFVFDTPTNAPWATLYEGVYRPFVQPLALATLFVALAFIGVRTGALAAGRRRRLLARIAIALLVVVLWFPVAAGVLRLFDALGLVIATGGSGTSGDLIASFGDALKAGTGGGVALVIFAVETVVLLIAAVAYAVRWLALIVLTLMMPVVAATWAMDVWPLSTLAGIARRAAGIYPGLLVAGVPAAILLRVAITANFDFGFGGVFGILVSGMLVPAAAGASAATVLWSNQAIAHAVRRSAHLGHTTAIRSPTAVKAGKSRTDESLRGARTVHRRIVQQQEIDSTREGALWRGESSTHRDGRHGRRATRHSRNEASQDRRRREESQDPRRAANAPTGSLLTDGISTGREQTCSRARAAARRTKEKIARR